MRPAMPLLLLLLAAALLAPGCGPSLSPAQQMQRDGKSAINNIIGAASRAPLQYKELKLTYLRGQKGQATIDLTLHGDLRYALRSDASLRREDKVVLDGKVKEEDLRKLYKTIDGAGLLYLKSTYRPLGEAEEPVEITMSYRGKIWRLYLGQDDVDTSASFKSVEEMLLELVDRLSGGRIVTVVD